MLKHYQKFFIFSFLISNFCFFNSKAQTNLVPNPSFENYTACPSNAGEVYKATGWDSYRNSPDYFHTCSSFTQVKAPQSYFGYQLPSTGNAYCGFIAYYGSSFDREIIGVALTTSMTILQKYFISFLVSRSDSNYVAGYSINKIGVKFCTVKPSNVAINNFAHFYTNTIITDTINWTRVFGSFVADSAYKHMMIGNFFDDANTTIINDGNGVYGYYFLDDVCLSTDSIFAQNYFTGLKESGFKNEIKVFPNPATNEITISVNVPVTIYNSFGLQIDAILETKNNTVNIDCSKWEPGLYFLKGMNLNQKIIINH